MLGLIKEFNLYWESLIRFFYPSYCAVCRTGLLLQESFVCSPCFGQIELLKPPQCIKCAKKLPPFGTNSSICSDCRSDKPYYDRGYALISYNEQAKAIFHQVKFQQKPWLLNIFLPFIDSISSALGINNYDAILPVPLDLSRSWHREFNQSALIAKMLLRSERLGSVPVQNLLKKSKKTLPQNQLGRTDRLTNLLGAFSVRSKQKVRGRRFLLVDDIFTTGSTINECAKVLKENGAEQVDFFTVARTPSS